MYRKDCFLLQRQWRFTFDEQHFFVDLVFYNRLLQCYVLIDLKMGKLTHQDLGQMQMYVNYYDRHMSMQRLTSSLSARQSLAASQGEGMDLGV